MHSDAFWAPRGTPDVWQHLQYIYDEYMTKPETEHDMYRQGLEVFQDRRKKFVLSWEVWDMVDKVLDKLDKSPVGEMDKSPVGDHNALRGSGRVSDAAQHRMIDEVLDEMNKSPVDEMDKDRMIDEVLDEMNKSPVDEMDKSPVGDHNARRGSGRVSDAAQDRTVDEVLDEMDKSPVDEASAVGGRSAKGNSMNHI